MPRALQSESDGMAAALAIHLCAYCAVGALFALLLYYLMQPTRLPNPGIAALKTSPTTVSYVEWLRSERDAAKRGAVKRDLKVEPEPETTGAAARQTPEPNPEAKKTKAAQVQQRTRAARRPQPADTTHYAQHPPETTHYAQQPSFGGYQPMY
jgi:hypothetical protein